MSENEAKERAKPRKRRRPAPAPVATHVARLPEVTRRPPIGRSEREAVLALNAMFYRAFEVRDSDAMGEIWAHQPYVRCIHPGWEPLVGWDEVVGSWCQIFRGAESLRFELVDVSVRVGGSLAWVELTEVLEARHQGGRARSLVLATNIFERSPAGRWQMIHHHASPVMVREPTPRQGGQPIH